MRDEKAGGSGGFPMDGRLRMFNVMTRACPIPPPVSSCRPVPLRRAGRR